MSSSGVRTARVVVRRATGQSGSRRLYRVWVNGRMRKLRPGRRAEFSVVPGVVEVAVRVGHTAFGRWVGEVADHDELSFVVERQDKTHVRLRETSTHRSSRGFRSWASR